MRFTVVDNVVNCGIFRNLNFEQFTFEFYFRQAKVDEKDEFWSKPIVEKGEIGQKLAFQKTSVQNKIRF